MSTPAQRARLRVLMIFALAVTAVSVFVWVQSKRLPNKSETPPVAAQHQSEAFTPGSSINSAKSPGADPTPAPVDMEADAGIATEGQPQPQDTPLANNFIGTLKLIIPVAAVKPEQLLDTFTDSRSEGRAHDAIDIIAPAGTPVLAAGDGEIVRLFQSERGGTTIYQLSADQKLIFYYAHLQRYADGIAVGKLVRQGEIIAFVGDTGNAGVGNYHLHFSVSIPADPKRYWEGTNINPYPLLK